ncbi:MAG: AGE family epimerase/isomerase [Bacteroidaceae bacterium]|nr:AGE family epimerase/isomerase [Bacteroidaceae bacterium]
MNPAICQLRAEALECLTQNILPFWLDKMQDNEHGGWYGRMDGHGTLHPQAEKGAILNARILWSFSAACRVLAKEGGRYQDLRERCLQAAARTKDYFLRHFLDREQGGVYWSVDYLGRPLDTKKQFYAIGFAIYGLSEYARATGDAEALQAALVLFEDVERHAWDPVHGGYIEASTRDWQPISDMRLSDKDENYPKSQNTHLHIIEPYTNLLRALKERSTAAAAVPAACIDAAAAVPAACIDAAPAVPAAASKDTAAVAVVAGAVRRLLSLFAERILNPATRHLDLFFQMDWSRMSTTESYGHDIECSWLLHEAALVLGDADVLHQLEPVVQQVAVASERGLLPNGAMIHESGDPDLHWWVQAEAVVGFLNIYQHFGDEAALARALAAWQFIKDHLIDRERGEWYWSLRADGCVRPVQGDASCLKSVGDASRETSYSVNLDEDHAGFWKCPYHNSRMCLEILERFPTGG